MCNTACFFEVFYKLKVGLKCLSRIPLFGGTPAASGSADHDLKFISQAERILQKCSYGKVDLFRNSRFRRVQVIGGDKILLRGFYTPDHCINSTISGTCEELVKKVGQRLQKKEGRNYIFSAVHGQCPQYGMSHVYLTAFPSSEINRRKVDNLLNAGRLTNEDLTGCILIDPSFQLIEKRVQGSLFDGYIPSHILMLTRFRRQIT
jgi:hypothetical protein